MKRAAPALSAVRMVSLLLPVAPLAAGMTACIPPSANLQSARTLDEGQTRITPYVTTSNTESRFSTDEKLSDNYGVLFGVGHKEDYETQIRFEQFRFADEDEHLYWISFGPKIEVAENMLAVLIPVGMYLGPGNPLPTMQFHPGLIGTIPASRFLELTGAAKVIIAVAAPQYPWVVFNVGASVSTDVTRWAIIPELAYSTNVRAQEVGIVTYGVGVAFYTR